MLVYVYPKLLCKKWVPTYCFRASSIFKVRKDILPLSDAPNNDLFSPYSKSKLNPQICWQIEYDGNPADQEDANAIFDARGGARWGEVH